MIQFPEPSKYLFERHCAAEVSHNWLLAGVLTIDIPKAALPLTKHRRQGIDAIVAQLIVESQMGDWGTDTVALGGPWPDDARYSDDALRAWAARSTTAMVRVRVQDEHVRAEIRMLDEANEGEPGPTLH
jgi:hypothetical protein